MFLRNDHGLDQAGGTATLSFGRSIVPVAEIGLIDRLRTGIARTDWAPDLGAQIGSASWWRGAATCTALIAATWQLSPGLDRTIAGDVPPALTGAQLDEARASAIAPLAEGADSGRHIAANDLVMPLAETPERPIVELTATLGEGDDFTRMLRRAGVSQDDAGDAARLIAGAMPLGEIAAGTRIDLTLGRRADRNIARPLERLAFRARFDLGLSLARAGGALAMTRQAIAIDHTPLRIRGLVGASLYRSARAAGAPAKVVEGYIKALASRLSIGRDVNAGDTFDIIIEQARAATGEVRTGALMFAGLDQDRRKTELVKWTDGQWYAASGQTERQGTFLLPVAGRITSGFGMRMHPLLGFTRMHKGIDLGAPWGTPVHAPADGTVLFAGRRGGYGNFMNVSHGGGIATGYGHLSAFAARVGAHVTRGEVIAYVGSTGMSTGPHLHWEVWRNGVAVNPQSFSFASVATLSGDTLRAFKAKVAALLAVKPGKR